MTWNFKAFDAMKAERLLPVEERDDRDREAPDEALQKARSETRKEPRYSSALTCTPSHAPRTRHQRHLQGFFEDLPAERHGKPGIRRGGNPAT